MLISRALFFLSLVIIFSSSTINCNKADLPSRRANGCSGNESRVDGHGYEELAPLIKKTKTRMVMNETRRKLGSFQICAPCTCCAGNGGLYCLPSPCCYAINCNIPNRPFGFCSFTPKTCHCFRCHA